MQNQKTIILKYLIRNGKVGCNALLRWGIASHTKVISELRKDGHFITNEKSWNKKKKCVNSVYHFGA